MTERLFIRNLAAACVVLIGIAAAIFYWRLFALGSIMAREGIAPPGMPPVWYALAMMAPHAAIVALFARTPTTGFAWGFAHNVAAVTIFALPAMVVLMPGVLLLLFIPDTIVRIYPLMAAALLVGTVLQPIGFILIFGPLFVIQFALRNAVKRGAAAISWDEMSTGAAVGFFTLAIPVLLVIHTEKPWKSIEKPRAETSAPERPSAAERPIEYLTPQVVSVPATGRAGGAAVPSTSDSAAALVLASYVADSLARVAGCVGWYYSAQPDLQLPKKYDMPICGLGGQDTTMMTFEGARYRVIYMPGRSLSDSTVADFSLQARPIQYQPAMPSILVRPSGEAYATTADRPAKRSDPRVHD